MNNFHTFCYVLPHGEEYETSVWIDLETGEFNEARALLNLTEDIPADSATPVSKHLRVGDHKLAVEQMSGSDIVYVDPATMRWSSTPREDCIRQTTESLAGLKPMRVSDVTGFLHAVAENEERRRTDVAPQT